ncbi:DoxX family protein [Pseudopedobacter beijingensis]|uniref:DoxX family protein n=1 Tax=Pseudopedobacter beijingensis TaxID=1207056 RepID=A0ABW4IAC0_9SPHI
MEKTKHTTYWIITGLLCLSLSGGIGQLLQVKEVVEGFAPLGYPTYFISIIGFWKIMAIIALLVPKFPLLKEWAYAGIVFAMTGASISHIVSGSELFHIIAPLIIVILAVVSWYLRPASRKLCTA